MTTEEISQRLDAIPDKLTGSNWGFAFLKCFQGKDSKLPKSTFDRVKDGSTNYADDQATEILWKKRIYFHWVKKDVRTALLDAKASAVLRRPANKPMFIVIASPEEIAAHDLDESEDLVIPRYELPSHAYFFLPFVGKKKITVTSEALEVDVKATRKMAVLYDEIRKDNSGFEAHDLNVFLARLLFCFFAEDTGIFDENLFTNSLASHTSQEGDDLADYLATLFRRFATADASAFRKEFRDFKYVNGGLFEREHPVPAFTRKSRKTLLENGKMDWKAINPDIFGSMFQSIIDPEKRHELGMHYTTRENIMKVVSPLFLDALRVDFEKATENGSELFPDRKINPEDQVTGWIYVLRSLSKAPQVQGIPNLHKIGFTTETVESRIAGAEKFVTYLCAPVEVVATAKVANMPSHPVEQLIHAVFAKARLDIEITDSEGQIKKANEWFSAPWSAIEHAIQLIVSEQVGYYEYNPESAEMEFRK